MAGSIEKAAPVSQATPDIVTIKSAGQPTDHSMAATETFHVVSPSIIAETGPEPQTARKSGESGKTQQFDPASLVIRAGIIGGAAPIRASATGATSPEISGNEQHPTPESDGEAPATDQGKPSTVPG